uniref:Uncharacterized protein n=2 Tax=Strongyloides stercoralis TaxID=6248 RepID=A0AAF5CR61_STRER
MTSIEVDSIINEITKVLNTTNVKKLSFEYKKNESNANHISLNVMYNNMENASKVNNLFQPKNNHATTISKKSNCYSIFKDLETAKSNTSLPDLMSGRFVDSHIRCDGNCNKMNSKKKMKAYGICDHVVCKNCRDKYKYVFKMFNLNPSCTNLQCLTSILMTVLKEKDEQLFKECWKVYNNIDRPMIFRSFYYYPKINRNIIPIDNKFFKKKVYSTTGNIKYYSTYNKKRNQNEKMVNNNIYYKLPYYKISLQKDISEISKKVSNFNGTISRLKLPEENLINQINSYKNNNKILFDKILPVKDNSNYQNIPVNNIDNTLHLSFKIAPSKHKE